MGNNFVYPKPQSTANLLDGLNWDGCEGGQNNRFNDWTPTLPDDHVIVGMRVLTNDTGIRYLDGIFTCSLLKLGDIKRVLRYVTPASTVRHQQGTQDGPSVTWRDIIAPVGHVIYQFDQRICRKMRAFIMYSQHHLNSNEFWNSGWVGVPNSWNWNGYASKSLIVPNWNSGRVYAITRLHVRYLNGDSNNDHAGVTMFIQAQFKDITDYSNTVYYKQIQDYASALCVTDHVDKPKDFCGDYFATTAQTDAYADDFCPTNYDKAEWCACYLPRETVLSDPTLLAKYPLAKYTSNGKCWNESCFKKGYKNKPIREGGDCSICVQDIGNVSNANNTLIKNLNITQNCISSVTNNDNVANGSGSNINVNNSSRWAFAYDDFIDSLKEYWMIIVGLILFILVGVAVYMRPAKTNGESSLIPDVSITVPSVKPPVIVQTTAITTTPVVPASAVSAAL